MCLIAASGQAESVDIHDLESNDTGPIDGWSAKVV